MTDPDRPARRGRPGGQGRTSSDPDASEPSRQRPRRPASTGPNLPLLTRLNQRGFRLVMLGDGLALYALMVLVAVVRYGLLNRGTNGWFDWPTYPVPLYLLSFALLTSLYLVTFYFGGLYEREPRLGFPPALPRVVRLALIATGLFAGLEFVATSLSERIGEAGTARALPMPLINLTAIFFLGSIMVAGLRRAANWMRVNREGPPRAILVGAPDEVNTARKHLDDEQERINVVAEFSDVRGLVDRVQELGVTDVVLLSSRWLDTLYPTVLTTLEDRGVNVLQRVTAKETMFGLERVRQVGGLPFVLLRSHTIPASRIRFKRFTDLVFLTAASPILLPLLLLTAIYVRLVAGSPILFWQERVGRAGARFRMVKFRTMYANAEEDGSPRLATRDDPRIIPACTWLRATRLDELPQIYNILRGDMALVGPRPERPELTEQFEQIIPGYERRHELPPGLTGLAQIHGRYHTDPEYKLGYDLQYLVNWSPVLDLEIIARTVAVVLLRRV